MNKEFNLDLAVARLRGAKDLPQLEAAMIELTARLGFDQFALGHHVDLLSPPGDAIRLTNYHPDWIDQSLEKGYFTIDPVHAVSARLVSPFIWTELDRHMVLGDHHRHILDSAARYGLKVGITIPVHMPGEYQGTCSFAARDFERLHPYAFALAQAVATHAFESARRIIRALNDVEPLTIPHVSPRAREAMILVGRGKTDDEIGSVLGISRTTAHGHVETARRIYGNAQRSLMVLRAIFDGVITYADVFGRNAF
ncbi:helix-turn-helix transcriptional regulator [Novosphingobium album (ex Liu et al. 2023)]|uniref:Autoinducer binding domain-containing protein n=1 Tax=Novosphingobium album (ex Liu et al. 2023) TaxID=3031130 RepID=A0ABT5WQI2_9SPHN|nr:autoinducer binding domain-containing protein [Novosphingobium album (ex Liu et al. 2023)]MDE8652311.1 autoinducer binding domain-containing protein [Novosphingobium album (ex Liu et al. 2023)]